MQQCKDNAKFIHLRWSSRHQHRCGHRQPNYTYFSHNQIRNHIEVSEQNNSYGSEEKCYSSVHSPAQRILDTIDRLDYEVDPSTYRSLLEVYTKSISLSECKRVHGHIVIRGMDRLLQDDLLQMYCACEAVEDALAVFHNMEGDFVDSQWNLMMKTLSENGEFHGSVRLFERMCLQGIIPDKISYMTLISAICHVDERFYSMKVHFWILCNKIGLDSALTSSLVDWYTKCDQANAAARLFDYMGNRNVIIFTSFISSHVQQFQHHKALQLFCQMQQEAHMPNKITFISMASASAGLKNLSEGRRLHILILSSGCASDIVVSTALANMYGKCTGLQNSLEILNELSDWNVVTWNAIIATSVQCCHPKEALGHFYHMQQVGLLPDRVTFLTMIDGCAAMGEIRHGKWLHATLTYHDLTLGNALINLYDRCGRLTDARSVFSEMPTRDTVSWNTIINAYSKRGYGKEALKIFYQMEQEGFFVDNVTLCSFFMACTTELALAEGAQMHARIAGSNLLTSHLSLGSAIIKMYGECGKQSCAQKVFDNLHEHNIVTWNALVAVYSQLGDPRRALLLLENMLWEGMIPTEATFVSITNSFSEPAYLSDGERLHCVLLSCGFGFDNQVCNAFINMYGKCGRLESSRVVFDKMLERDVVSWSTMIGVYGEHGKGKKALQLFDEMLDVVDPDSVTFLNVLVACNRCGLVDVGKYLFEIMIIHYRIIPNADHYGCMVDLLGRCGLLHEAENLILCMPSHPSYTAWMSFLGSCRVIVDVKRAEVIAEHILEYCTTNHQPYVLLSNVYAMAGRKEDTIHVRGTTKHHSKSLEYL